MLATFAESGSEAFRKTMRREEFVTEMDRVLPWRGVGSANSDVVLSGNSDHLRDSLGWKSVYTYNAETFSPNGTLGRITP